MNNPIAIFRNLREVYRRYLDSPLAIRYDLLREERHALLFGQDRRLWREPLIEPVPTYPPCGAEFTRVSDELLDASWGDKVAGEVAGFLGHHYSQTLKLANCDNRSCISARLFSVR